MSAVAIIGLCSAVQAGTIYVSPGGNDANDGLSWASAKKTVQAGTDATVAGDEVVLQPGTYTGSGNCDISFKGKAITVRGTNPDDPAVVAATIIDGQSDPANHIYHNAFVFQTNETAGSGLSGLTMVNCSGNASLGRGGTILCLPGSPTIRNCRIRQSDYGIYAPSSSPSVINCTIEYNSKAAIYAYGGMPLVRNCTITDNIGYAVAVGGGMVSNCLITRNTGSEDGIVRAVGSATIVHCTIVGNYLNSDNPYNRGALFLSGSGISVSNCIIWGNMSQQIKVYSGTPTIRYSCVQGGWTGTGNIGADPKLTADGHLTGASPCVNTGDPAFAPAEDAIDGDGEARLTGPAVDMGWDEFTDGDADGLPDRWETRYFGSTQAADPATDTDGDGFSNLAEYARSCNPLQGPRNFYVDPVAGNDAWDGQAPAFGDGNGPKKTIQAAVDAADVYEQDVVILASGTYRGPGNWDIDLGCKAITVRSAQGRTKTVLDCQDGQAYHKGFSLHSNLAPSTVIEGLTITNSKSGAITCSGGSATVQHCNITQNPSTGITCSGGPLILTNCLIAENGWRGVYCLSPTVLKMSNCTVTGHTEVGVTCGSNSTIRNSIIWGNASTSSLGTSTTVTYSVVDINPMGGGGLIIDPMVRRDGHLLAGSPCIDAGDPAYAPASGLADADGEERIVGGRVDIGADELLDGDADRMPDCWEEKYFGSTTAADPAGDADGDGYANLYEWDSNYDPLVACKVYYVDPVAGNDTWDGLAAALDGTHGPKKTIVAAVNAAASFGGDRVILAPGVYRGGVRVFGKELTIQSIRPADPAVAAATILDCGQNSQAFSFDQAQNRRVAVVGLTVINGWSNSGGALDVVGVRALVANCIFRDCSPSSGGPLAGAVLIKNQGQLSLVNSIVQRCSISSTGSTGGGIYCVTGSANITNSILWGNVPDQIGKSSLASVSVDHSIVQGGYAGIGNLNQDPQLRPDSHLMANSVCINAGDPNFDPCLLPYEIDGEARVVGGRVDIGPDEFVDSDTDGLPDWWEQRYFGTPTQADSAADPDGDQQSNLDEYNRGSDPTQGPVTYYVDPAGGNDMWDGLTLAWDGNHGPMRTIQKAMDTASAYERNVIVLASGTYAGAGNHAIDFKGKLVHIRSTNPDDPAVVAATIIDFSDSNYLLGYGFRFVSYETAEAGIAGLTITRTAPTHGNAVECQDSSPVIRNCVLRDNTTCAMRITGGSPAIIGCRFLNNSNQATSGAAGISASSSAVTVDHCYFAGNYGNSDGGAVCIYSGTMQITQCMFVDNTVSSYSGAGIHLDYPYDTAPAQVTVDRCTLLRNRLYVLQGSVVVTNSIIWDGLYASSSGNWTATYSCIQGGRTGTGNISANPLLTPDGHLGPGSPCINKADPTHVSSPGQTDFEGDPRLVAGQLDMGADEFVDTDDDTLPDWWEEKWFGSAAAADPNGDPDANGIANTDECIYGGDPIKPATTYYVDSIAGDDAWDGLATVRDTSHGPKRTIQSAMDAAMPFELDQVVLLPGTYKGTGDVNLDYKGKALIVRGTDPGNPDVVARTVIDCTRQSAYGSSQAFYFRTAESRWTVLAGISITGCTDTSAIAINYDASPNIQDCRFQDNAGTAIYMEGGSATISRCSFERNGTGAQILGNTTISRCRFVANTTKEIDIRGNGNITIVDSLVMAGKQAVNIGYVPTVNISRSTILANPILTYAPITFESTGTATVDHSILWGRPSPATTKLQVTYSDIQGGYTGSGNIAADPELTPDGWLRAGSPCINAGDPAYTSAPGIYDLRGQARPVGDRLDMGAVEWNDSDADGLPDWWERQYFGSTIAGNSGADTDGDGLTNLQEYLAGRNPLLGPRTLYVAPGGNDAWDGLASESSGMHGPKLTIQAAIDAAGDRETDQVVILPGTYTGAGNREITYKGKAITVRSIDPDDPSVVAATVIDRQGSGSDKWPAVRFEAFEKADSILAGITITKGLAPAVSCRMTSPIVRNCVLTSHGYGYSPYTIVNLLDSQAVLENCRISDNDAYNICIGVTYSSLDMSVLGYTAPAIRNCTMQRGGSGLSSNGPVLMEGCVISDNTRTAVGCTGPGIVFSRCRIANNTGAISCNSAARATFRNCHISGTNAGSSGSASVVYGESSSEVTMINCSILNNRAAAYSRIFYRAKVTLLDCLVWGNTPTTLAYPGPITVTYSCIQDAAPGDGTVYAGTGNIDLDPLLTADGHLNMGSPCINTGDPAYVPAAGETDIDGQPRVIGGRMDMGACEYSLPGDIDGDGAVDAADFELFRQAFGHRRGEQAFRADADYDSDGLVSFVDYQAWLGYYRAAVGNPLAVAPGSLTGNTPARQPQGDTNGDGYINVGDLQVLVAGWGTQAGQSQYDARTDFNNDGYVNVGDLMILVKYFNTYGNQQ